MPTNTTKTILTGDPASGNHVAKIRELSERLGAGVHDIDVLHDDWCALLKSSAACNCDPQVTLRPSAARELLQRAEDRELTERGRVIREAIEKSTAVLRAEVDRLGEQNAALHQAMRGAIEDEAR